MTKQNQLEGSTEVHQAAQYEIDPLLLPLLNINTEEEREQCLSALLTDHLVPRIKETIRYHPSFTGRNHLFWYEDAINDIHHDVLVQLLGRLRLWLSKPSANIIRDSCGLTVHITRQTVAAHWRQQKPQRNRLREKLRYLLTHQPELGTWGASDGTAVCGFTNWRGMLAKPAGARSLQMLLDEEAQWRKVARPDALQQGARMAQLIATILNEVGAPIPITFLVSLLADYFGIQDQTASLNDLSTSATDSLTSLQTLAVTSEESRTIERRFDLRQIWIMLCELPLEQRRALLLNLRYGNERGLIVLLVELGIVTLNELLQMLQFEEQQFLSLWQALPLNDAQIAELLGFDRQKIINLRQRARQLLSQKMRNLRIISLSDK